MNDLEKRTHKGQFPKGVSGNPAGKPKGTKNKITLLKQSLELQLREQSENRLPEVMDKAIELAVQGDRSMLKLLLELHMSKGGADSDKEVSKAAIIINTGQAPDIKDITPKEDEDETDE